jgi:hypothetical protein
MSQFKPGDLALTIVDDPEIPAYSVVTLDSAIKKGEDCLTWDEKPSVAKEDGWFVIHTNAADERLYAERELMPLKGNFQPEQQKSREVVE